MGDGNFILKGERTQSYRNATTKIPVSPGLSESNGLFGAEYQ